MMLIIHFVTQTRPFHNADNYLFLVTNNEHVLAWLVVGENGLGLVLDDATNEGRSSNVLIVDKLDNSIGDQVSKGDLIVSVNGISLRSKPFGECLLILKENIVQGESVQLGIEHVAQSEQADKSIVQSTCPTIPNKQTNSSDELDDEAKMESLPGSRTDFQSNSTMMNIGEIPENELIDDVDNTTGDTMNHDSATNSPIPHIDIDVFQVESGAELLNSEPQIFVQNTSPSQTDNAEENQDIEYDRPMAMPRSVNDSHSSIGTNSSISSDATIVVSTIGVQVLFCSFFYGD